MTLSPRGVSHRCSLVSLHHYNFSYWPPHLTLVGPAVTHLSVWSQLCSQWVWEKVSFCQWCLFIHRLQKMMERRIKWMIVSDIAVVSRRSHAKPTCLFLVSSMTPPSQTQRQCSWLECLCWAASILSQPHLLRVSDSLRAWGNVCTRALTHALK